MRDLEISKAKHDAFVTGDGWLRISRQADGALVWTRVAPHRVTLRLLFCRECSEAKHRNCDGTAWDNEADAPAPCTCPDRSHQ